MTRLKKIFLALTGRERMVFLSATALLVITGVILSGIILSQYTRVVPASGGEYTDGFLDQPTHVNPVITTNLVDKSIIRMVFSNIPDISKKIAPSEDGRIWEIRIKENLKWQDGEKLTTDDIIFTIQKMQDPESVSPLAKLWL